MARQEGTLKLNSNLETLFNAPLDARSRVTEKSDLYTLPYVYRGMLVSVTSEDKVYLLVSNDHTQADSWKDIGGITAGAGWGIVTVGTSSLSLSGNWGDTNVDVTALGLKKDDYRVLLWASGGDELSGAWSQVQLAVQNIQDTFFTVTGYHQFCETGNIYFQYAIIAKGYGGASGDGVGDATVYRYPPRTGRNIVCVRNLDKSTGEYEGGNEVVFEETTNGIEISGTSDFSYFMQKELAAVDYVDDAVSLNVATKTDLYALEKTWRGMIVYVKDSGQYYKLINDLPAFEASWEEVQYADFDEVTESEIDSMFE